MKKGITIGIGMTIALFLMFMLVPRNVSAGGEIGEVSASWSSKKVEQDTNGRVTLSMENVGEDQLRLTFIGVHFDWMEDNIYWFDQDVSEEEPHYLASGQTYSSRLVFEVPSNVLTGSHGYTFYIAYEEDDGWWGWEEMTWTSQTQYDFYVTEIDSDNDGIPDSADNYYGEGANSPNDEKSSKDGNTNVIILVVLGLFVFVTIAIITVILIVKGRKKKRVHQEYSYSRPQRPIPEDRSASPLHHNDVPRPPRIPLKKTLPLKEEKIKKETFSHEVSICPYCGEDLNFPKPPKFCPYCREQISK